MTLTLGLEFSSDVIKVDVECAAEVLGASVKEIRTAVVSICQATTDSVIPTAVETHVRKKCYFKIYC